MISSTYVQELDQGNICGNPYMYLAYMSVMYCSKKTISCRPSQQNPSNAGWSQQPLQDMCPVQMAVANPEARGFVT